METNSSNYTWNQTENELEIRIPLSTAVKAKDVSVEFKKKHLKAGIKGQKPIIDSELENEIDCSDDGATTWALENGGKELLISLDTCTNKKWKRVLKSDELNVASTTTEEPPDRTNPVDIDKLAADLIEKMGIGRPDPEFERKRQETKDKLKVEHPDIDFEKCIFN